MTLERIAIYISALIYFVVSCISAGIQVDQRLKTLNLGRYAHLSEWEEITKMLPMACAPAAIVVLLTYIIGCVDKD